MGYYWTDEEKDLAVSGHNAGMTARQIAEKLNLIRGKDAFSRNAVIGKLHRLGIGGGPRNERPRRRPHVQVAKIKPRPVIVQAPIPPRQVDDIARKTLVDLEPHDCRFPVGEPERPGFGFCADRAVQGTSYCAGHLDRVSRVRAA